VKTEKRRSGVSGEEGRAGKSREEQGRAGKSRERMRAGRNA